jgi:murein DD-endopeptidase MepM/ murein hydrolase activator NlpD
VKARRVFSRPLRSASQGAAFSLAMVLAFSGTVDAGPRERSDLAEAVRTYDELVKREHSIEKYLESTSEDFEQLRLRVTLRGRAYYRLTRGLPTTDLFAYASLVERTKRALLADLKKAEALEAERKRAEGRLREVREARKALAVTEETRKALQAQTERERAFDLAFSGGTVSKSHTAIYGALTPHGFGGETFSSLKGELPFPVPGRAEVEVVRRSYAEGPGLILRTAIGTPARSVYQGRVAFADHYPEYGNTVIIDHGENYFTVTAGLSSIDARVGEEVVAGARLGIAGIVDGRAEIYIEIRRGRDTLSPNEWFGI